MVVECTIRLCPARIDYQRLPQIFCLDIAGKLPEFSPSRVMLNPLLNLLKKFS